MTYGTLLERTRHELAVIKATLSLFERGDDRPIDHRPAHVRNLFKRGEPLAICRAALSAEPAGLTTLAVALPRASSIMTTRYWYGAKVGVF